MLIALNKRGQSMLEYAILLAVIIAAIVIMQVFVKRRVMGGFKDASEKISSDGYSAGGTTTNENRVMSSDQVIQSESGTTANLLANFQPTGVDTTGTLDQTEALYSASSRTGGHTVSTVKSKTDGFKDEKSRWVDYDTDEVTDYPDPVP